MKTIIEDVPRSIDPETLYHLSEAKQRLGWGAHAMRAARRAGLKVLYVHKRAYLRGSDIIAYIAGSEGK